MLAERRRALRWTVREAARRVGTSCGYLSMLEHAQRAPSLSLASDLDAVYDLPQEDAQALLDAAIPGAGRDCPPRWGRGPRPSGGSR